MAALKPPLGAELRADHPLSENLIGFWLFNEGGGTGFTDLTGHNHGTYTGSSGTDFADWGTDEGLNFGSDGGGATAGGNHRISLGTVTADNPLSLAGNTACTFIFRANYGSSAGSNDFPRLASKGDGGNGANGWTLYGGNNGARTMAWTCDGQTTTVTAPMFADNDTFYTIGVVRSGANLRWFRDGAFFSTNSVTPNAPPATSAEGTILNWHSTNREWAGRIEFLGIWDRAMTDAEVARFTDDPYQHVRPRTRQIGRFLSLIGGVAGQSITPTGIASGEAFGSPSISVGAVTVSPTGIASDEAFGAATVSNGAVAITPTGIASGETFGAPSVDVGTVTISPTGIASDEAFGSAAVGQGGVTITPPGIATGEAFGAATVALGAVSISPTGIATGEAFGSAAVTLAGGITAQGIPSAEAFGSHTLSPGAVSISPTGIASGEAFGAHTFAVAAISITPTGIASAEAFGSASLSVGAVTISPTGITSGEAFGVPIIADGAVIPSGLSFTLPYRERLLHWTLPHDDER